MRAHIALVFSALIVFAVELSVPIGSICFAQGAVIRKPTQKVVDAIAKYLTRRGGRELAEELAELGGEATVRRIAERAVREGGEDALNALVRAARAHGPDVLRAVDNAVNVPRLLRAVDELPEDIASKAVRRLGAGADGRALAEVVENFGSQALRAEVRHPGIGGQLVARLGDDGAAVATHASRDQAITLSRHADDIARLPEPQRAELLKLLRADTDRMVSFMGRFVERNPGKTLFTAATTAIILANPERVLGGDDIIIDKNGNPQVVSKPGLVGRMLETRATNWLRAILYVPLSLLAIGVCAWIVINLWFAYRLNRLKLTHAEQSGALKNGLTNRSTGAAKSRDLPIENQSSQPGDQ